MGMVGVKKLLWNTSTFIGVGRHAFDILDRVRINPRMEIKFCSPLDKDFLVEKKLIIENVFFLCLDAMKKYEKKKNRNRG